MFQLGGYQGDPMLWIGLAAAVIACGAYLLRQSAKRRMQRDFRDLVDRAEALNASREAAKPDLMFAARGFAAVALLKANGMDVDLHDAERSLAEKALQDGATVQQALSLRWGGVQAIHTEPELYSMAVAAAEEIGSTDRYHHGAAAHLAMVMDQHPGDYADFVAYVQRG